MNYSFPLLVVSGPKLATQVLIPTLREIDLTHKMRLNVDLSNNRVLLITIAGEH